MPASNSSAVVNDLVEQAEELCEVHDHITRIIADLDVSRDTFSDQYAHPGQAQFDFKPVIRMFLYQHAREFNDSELPYSAAMGSLSTSSSSEMNPSTTRFPWTPGATE